MGEDPLGPASAEQVDREVHAGPEPALATVGPDLLGHGPGHGVRADHQGQWVEDPAPPLESFGPEPVGWEPFHPGWWRVPVRPRLGERQHPLRRLEVGEVEAATRSAEHRGGQVAVGRSRVPHLRPGVGQRAPAPQHLDLDVHGPVGHRRDEGGVQQADRRDPVAQFRGHRPGGESGDHTALGQRSQVPRRIDVPGVATGSDGVRAGDTEEGRGHRGTVSERDPAVNALTANGTPRSDPCSRAVPGLGGSSVRQGAEPN